MIEKAIIFATVAHEGQKRKGTNIPYILHPLEAANIAASIKYNEELVSAAVLHDIIEETPFTVGDIREQFSERVALLVAAETEDKSKTWSERKTYTLDHLKAEKDIDVLIVTLGDKLSNIRAIERDYQALGDELWLRFNKGKEEQSWYYQSLVKCMQRLDGTPAYSEFKRLVNAVFP